MRLRIRTLADEIVDLGVDRGHFTRPQPSDADLLDMSSHFALPGLVDAHAHLQANSVEAMVAAGEPVLEEMQRNAALQLAGGVLLIADKGSKSDRTLEMLDVAAVARPELHMAGALHVVEHGYYPGFGKEIDPENAADAAVRAAATRATWVKFIGDWPRRGRGPQQNFTEAHLAAAVAAAHRGGARVAVHTMAPETATAAVRAGVDSIEHGLYLTRADLTALGARGGAWVPTVVAMETVASTLRPGSSGERLIREGLDNVRELLGHAVAAGVHVLAGTDLALPHGEVAREVVRLGEYGLDPSIVLDAVVHGGYRYLGTGWAFAPGARADVVCVAGDPRDDLRVLLEPSLVMRMGRIVRGLHT